MDSVIHSTSSLLQTVLDSTAKMLVGARGNHDPEEKDFSIFAYRFLIRS